jgi:hypothetical protein
MQIFKNIFKNIKNFLKYFISPVAIIMWVTIQGIIVILYEIYCPDNYYYMYYHEIIYIFNNFSLYPLMFITIVYFLPLFMYENDLNTLLDLIMEIYRLFDYTWGAVTIRHFYETPLYFSYNYFDWAAYYRIHLTYGPPSLIRENLFELHFNAQIFLLICFVNITFCTLFFLYNSYRYYIDDKLILKLRAYYPTLSDILMEGRNLIFDIEHFFLMYPRLCITLVICIYMLLIVYSNCNIDIGIYNNKEEYLYRRALIENLIRNHIKYFMDGELYKIPIT